MCIRDRSTTSKEEPSIKSVKSFNNECVGSIIRLSINSDNKLFDESAKMESFKADSCVPDLIELPLEIVGLKETGTGNTVRELPDQVPQG